MAVAIAITQVKCETVDHKTLAVLRTQTWTTGSPIVFTKNRAGEFKRLTIVGQVTGGGSLLGQDLRYVPGMWVENGTTTGYGTGNVPNCYLWNIAAAGGPFQAGLLQSGLFSPLNNIMRNQFVVAKLLSATEFTIQHEFFMTYDEDLWFPASGDNQSRFLKSFVSDPVILTPDANSVYRYEKKALGVYVQMRDPSTYFAVYNEVTCEWDAAWYGEEDFNLNPPDYNNEVWKLTRGGVVTDLSTIQDTLVEFFVDVLAPTTTVERVGLYLIRVDTSDNNVTFWQNNEFESADIDGSMGGAFIAPSSPPTFIGGNQWKVSFTIDKSQITLGGCYRMIALVYNTGGGSYDSTTFISDQYCTTNIKPYDGALGGAIKLYDYHANYDSSKLTCTVEERLRAELSLSYFGGAWATDIFNRLGLVVTNDIRVYLKSARFLIYERRTDQAGILYTTDRRDVFTDITINQNGDGTFTAQSGAQFEVSMVESATGILDFRVRYESHIPNLYTEYDGVVQPLPLANQNWGGRDLTLEIQLEFYYHDYATPFTDLVIWQAALAPKNYVANPLKMNQPEFEICTPANKCFTPQLFGYLVLDPENYRLITTLEKVNGLHTTVGENEEYYLGQPIPQMDIPAITSQDVSFAAGTGLANFCIDTGMLDAGFQYKVVAIAKKLDPPATFKKSSFNASFN